jgi:Toprim-like
VAVTEAAIDALSLATLEGWPAGTAYVSTGGGFGPTTAEVLRVLLPASSRLVAATDRGQGGELLAERLHALAKEACASFGRLRSSAKDWNEQLTEGSAPP